MSDSCYTWVKVECARFNIETETNRHTWDKRVVFGLTVTRVCCYVNPRDREVRILISYY